jgi:hypothetical protein
MGAPGENEMADKIEVIRADQLRPGNKFLGPREFHITVESVERAAGSVRIKGVNGWGEGFNHRYNARTQVELLDNEVAR